MADIYQNKLNRYLKDGARSAKFDIMINPPSGLSLNISMNGVASSNANLKQSDLSDALTYFCYAGGFPGITSEVIEYKYLGRTIPIPSVATPNQTWSATFYTDEKHGIRKLFIDWIRYYQNHNYDTTAGKKFDQASDSVITIYQYDYDLKQKTKGCALFGAFPTSVSDAEISYENLSQMITFQTEFRYSFFEYFEIDEGLSSIEDVKNTVKNAVNDIVQNTISGVMNFGKSVASSTAAKLGITTDPISWLENQVANGARYLEDVDNFQNLLGS